MVPASPETSTLATPTVSEICDPNISRDNSSRPSASVPSRWMPPLECDIGGRLRSDRSCTKGSKGASWCTKSALMTATMRTTKLAVTILWVQANLPKRLSIVMASPQHRDTAVDEDADPGDERGISGQQKFRSRRLLFRLGQPTERYARPELLERTREFVGQHIRAVGAYGLLDHRRAGHTGTQAVHPDTAGCQFQGDLLGQVQHRSLAGGVCRLVH